MDQNSIEGINVICYEHDCIRTIMPSLYNRTKVKVIPFGWLKPFLLKSIFFQLYTGLFFKKKDPKKEINITMGVCSFVGDVVNIQFAHYFWNEIYFKVTKNSIFKNIYKKLYFSYLDICEDYYYRKDNLRFVFLSKFMKDSFTDKFKIPQNHSTLAYSSANSSRFSPSSINKEEIFQEIASIHPELKSLDQSKPTFLFVGAFERKGLPFLLEKIPQGSNFVIVGKPEIGSQIEIPDKENFFYVSHTNQIEKFYQCFDIFIFPTLFEPFGLVILEAAMSGMTLVVAKEKVGASELLENLEGVYFIDPYNIPSLNNYALIVSNEIRQERFQERNKNLSQLTWGNCAKQWQKALNFSPDDKAR